MYVVLSNVFHASGLQNDIYHNIVFQMTALHFAKYATWLSISDNKELMSTWYKLFSFKLSYIPVNVIYTQFKLKYS